MKKFSLLLFFILLTFFSYDVVGQVKVPTSINLAGRWRFSRDEAKVGIADKWYGDKLKTVGSGPSEIALPGSTDEAKAGISNPKKPTLEGLYRPNIYVGAAWYQREIEIPGSWKGKHITLFLERNHWVNHVWLDGQDYGTHDNLISPQIYDLGVNLQPGKHRLTICVDNTLKFDLGGFVSINYEGTQTNWNGIAGKIELQAADQIALNKIEVYPDVDRKLIRVKAYVNNITGSAVKAAVHFTVFGANGSLTGSPASVSILAGKGESLVEKEVPMGQHPKLWDEFSPNLYVLKTSLSAKNNRFRDEKSTSFGMRKLSIKGTQFTMNGRPLMLRGTLECAIFPLTAYPPTDVASWRRIFKIEKSYGLNFIRFHSWTPPDEAFTAADEEGVMIQAEGPLANINVGENPERDDFIEQELMGIIHTYGNHPSFCLLSIGNEYGGQKKIMTHWVDTLIKSDTRHCYTTSSAGDLTTNRQYSEYWWGRGIHGPNTMHDAKKDIPEEASTRPVTGHEIGQWTFYPNLNEMKKYTGVLEAKNFEMVRKDLKSKGMLGEAPAYFHATGEQAIMLYKEEIENLLRTPGYAGFSLLDLHDYPGQGTALVGLLNPFWDSKGLIKPEQHSRYCGATVPLLRMPQRTYFNSEAFEAKAELTHFGPHAIKHAQPEWEISDNKGKIIAHGLFAPLDITTGKLTKLGTVNASLKSITVPSKLKVTISLKNTAITNSWDIWVYPAAKPVVPADVVVSHSWNEDTRKALAEGKKVVLFPVLDSGKYFKGSFLPVFWSPVWFHSDPATMGISCDPKNPLFSEFPTDDFSNWQWWKLIQGSQTMILSKTPDKFHPLVQVIDNFARNEKLGTIFEAKVGKGKLLVCTLNLRDQTLPETSAFLKSLYDYLGSKSFQPTQTLNIEILNKILLPALK